MTLPPDGIRGIRVVASSPLGGLVVAVLLLGVAWALLLPPWQAPDENTHFAYVQSLVERSRLPGDPAHRATSTEQRLASRFAQADAARGAPGRKPQWSKYAYRRWSRLDSALPASAKSDGGGPSRTRNNPPLYYLYEAVPYAAASRGDVFTRLYAARLWSALLLVVTVTAVWLLAGELFKHDRLLQLAAAAMVGLQPMVTFISASVNPESMVIATWALALWLGVRLLRRGFTPPGAAALVAAVGLAAATKASGYALVPAAGLALAIAAWRRRDEFSTLIVGAALAGCAAIVLALAVRFSTIAETIGALEALPSGWASFKQFPSYLWQFYLPRPPFLEDMAALRPMPAYDTWVVTAWAAFGWGEVRFPPVVYGLVCAASVAAAATAGAKVLRRRRSLDVASASFCVFAAVALVFALHWADFRLAQGDTSFAHALARARQIPLDGVAGNPFLKGRYLLPLAPLAGVLTATALASLRPRWRPAAVAILLAALFMLQIASLGLVAERFYG